MSDVIEQTKQLSQKWRKWSGPTYHGANYEICADELDSLIPALEAEIAALQVDNLKLGQRIATACEDKRLAVAAALREAAGIIKKWKFMACSDADGLQAEVLALIPPADRDALDAYDAEVTSLVLDKIRAWLIHDDECAKLTNDDGVKCTCGLDESVCALVKGG